MKKNENKSRKNAVAGKPSKKQQKVVVPRKNRNTIQRHHSIQTPEVVPGLSNPGIGNMQERDDPSNR